MLDDFVKTVTGGLDGIASRLINAATERVKKKLSEAFSIKKLAVLRANISAVGKVKTILNPDSVSQLDQIFFPKAVSFNDGDLFIETFSNFSCNHVLIEGGPGQGKSLYLKNICLNEGRGNSFIPIFIEFRNLNLEKSLKEALSEAVRSFGIDIDDSLFDYLAKSEKVLFILDGFDEVSGAVRQKTARELENIGRVYPNLRILISSRPDSGMGASVYFTKFKIAPLQLNRQIEFLDHLYKDKRQAKDVVLVLNSSEFISKVTNTPLLLTLFAITYNARQFKPDSLSEFYNLIFPTMLYRHDRMKIGYERERKARLTDYQMEKIFESLSFFSLKEDKTHFGSSDFRRYLKSASELVRIDENLEDKLIDDITRITALIVPDGYDSYSYAHKSIQEYFSAVFISKIDESKRNKFYKKMLLSYDEFRKWENVLLFLATIDDYGYKKYFLLPTRKKALSLSQTGKVELSLNAIEELIGTESKIKIDENGLIINLYWQDTYSSSIYKKQSQLVQLIVTELLAQSRKQLAEFISDCEITDYEDYKHRDGNYIVSIIKFFKKSGASEHLCRHVSSNLEKSDLKKDIELLEANLRTVANMLDSALDFD